MCQIRGEVETEVSRTVIRRVGENRRGGNQSQMRLQEGHLRWIVGQGVY